MCPACVASAVMMIAGVMSTSGLAVVMNKLGVKSGVKKAFQRQNPKEEIWAK